MVRSMDEGNVNASLRAYIYEKDKYLSFVFLLYEANIQITLCVSLGYAF